MPNTAIVFARIDPNLKNDVDVILKELNVTPSSLIQMLYSQIKLTKGIPFEIKLPNRAPVFIDELNKEELDKEIDNGILDVKEGKTHKADEIDEILKNDIIL